MKTNISAIAPENIIKIWHKVAPLLEKATDKDSIITLEDIFNQLYTYIEHLCYGWCGRKIILIIL